MSLGPRLRGRRPRTVALVFGVVLAGILVAAVTTSAGQARSGLQKLQPRYTEAAAYDVSPPLRDLAKQRGRHY